MKRFISLLVCGILVMSMNALAATEEPVVISVTDVIAVPISVEAKNFSIEQDGSELFTIIVSENYSTGYSWSYTINDPSAIEFISEEIISPKEPIPGAPSERRMTFKVLKESISTISLKNARAFGDKEIAESFQILAYKNSETVIIEEDQQMHIMDGEQSNISLDETATYNNEEIMPDVSVQEINGITMIPLRATLEAMGYTVTWDGETRSVDLQKGAQWTAISIDKNAYFRNKMAPRPLSCDPIVVNSRTLVSVEFFSNIIGVSLEVENRKINFLEREPVIHAGYVKDITTDETGATTYIDIGYDL